MGASDWALAVAASMGVAWVVVNVLAFVLAATGNCPGCPICRDRERK